MSNVVRFVLMILAIGVSATLSVQAQNVISNRENGITTYRVLPSGPNGESITYRPYRQTPDSDLAKALFFEGQKDTDDPRSAEEQFYARTKELFPERLSRLDQWLDGFIQVGYFDLNDDGVDELIVQLNSSAYCASGVSGCTMYLFQRRNGVWAPIGDAQSNVRAIDERVDGWRTLWGADMGSRWRKDLGQYWQFCIDWETQVEGAGRCLEENG